MKQESRGFVMLILSLLGSVGLIILQDPSLRRAVVEWWNRVPSPYISQKPPSLRQEREHVYGIAREAEQILRREGNRGRSDEQ